MIRYAGPLWRILFADQGDPLVPVSAPEGRFHHSGQTALYASLTSEGAAVAIKRYVSAGDKPRVLQQFTAQLERLIDLRQLADPTDASVIWQDQRTAGQWPTTWTLSDHARAAGANGVIYPSRSRPDLSHVALFLWDQSNLVLAGPAVSWPAQLQD